MVLFTGKNYKYFIGYKDDEIKTKPLHIILPKTSAYVKIYVGETKWMDFLIKENLLKKYNDIWNKFSNGIKKDANPSILTIFLKPKKGLMVMRPGIFIVEKYLKKALIIFVDQ